MSRQCPYLGLVESRDQVSLTADAHHRCFVGQAPERIGRQYQVSTCLGAGHRHCPRRVRRAPGQYGTPVPPPPVPVPVAGPPTTRYTELGPARRISRRRLTVFDLASVGLVLSMVATALFLAYAVYHRQVVGPDMAVVLANGQEAPLRATLVPTFTPTATPTPTASPLPTSPLATPAATLPPATATPEPRPAAISPPTRLVIAKIHLDIPVKPVGPTEERTGNTRRIVWGAVPNAGGFHNTSSYPGNAGNIVINGHRDIAGSVFRRLDQVTVGDELLVYVGQVVYPYQVTEILIVPETYATAEQRASNRVLIGPYPEERLTLVTCTPVGLATHRLIVIAHPSPPTAPDLPIAGNEP